MMRRALLAVLLAGMWVALWGDASPGTVVAGLLAGVLVVVTVPVPASDRRLTVRPLPALAFVVTFAWLLVASTWAVVRLVLSDRARDADGVMIAYEVAPAAYAVRTLIAHSVSLTPGTLTVDVRADGRTLEVHVMDVMAVADARRSIAALEARAAAAFAPTPAPAPTPPPDQQAPAPDPSEVS